MLVSAVTPITLAALPAFIAGLVYKEWDIFLAKTEGAGALLAIRENSLPASVSQITLDCLADHVLGRALVFARRRLYFWKQRGWDPDGVVFGS
jgi:hypothetical protein